MGQKNSSKGAIPGLIIALSIVMGSVLTYSLYAITFKMQHDITLHEAALMESKALYDTYKILIEGGLRFAIEEATLKSGEQGITKPRWKEPREEPGSPPTVEQAKIVMTGLAQPKWKVYVDEAGREDNDYSKGSQSLLVTQDGDQKNDGFVVEGKLELSRQTETEYVRHTLQETPATIEFSTGLRYFYVRRLGDKFATNLDNILTYEAWASVNKLDDSQEGDISNCGSPVYCPENSLSYDQGKVDAEFDRRVADVEKALDSHFSSANLDWSLQRTESNGALNAKYGKPGRCKEWACGCCGNKCSKTLYCAKWHYDADFWYEYVVRAIIEDQDEKREVAIPNDLDRFRLKFEVGDYTGIETNCDNNADAGGFHLCSSGSYTGGSGTSSNPFTKFNEGVVFFGDN